jgi:hypothetical protein
MFFHLELAGMGKMAIAGGGKLAGFPRRNDEKFTEAAIGICSSPQDRKRRRLYQDLLGRNISGLACGDC